MYVHLSTNTLVTGVDKLKHLWTPAHKHTREHAHSLAYTEANKREMKHTRGLRQD